MKEKLIELLNKYFNVGDSDFYVCNRVKEAFTLGTMSLDDFSEVDEENTSDIADYLLENGVIVPPCKVGDTVYELQNKRIQAYTIETVTYNGRHFNFSWVLKDRKGIYGNVCGFDSSR